MALKYLKKAIKTSSTDDTKTREIVQNLLDDLEKSNEDIRHFIKKSTPTKGTPAKY